MRRLVGLLLGLVLAGSATAQNLPYHADPSARDIVPNLASVPAIRFLTTPDYPPFNFRDRNGEIVGFNVDLARAICATLTIACTIQTWPWEQAGDALADDQGDALIAGVALTPENGERFDFSSIYLELPARFVMRADEGDGFDPSALSGQQISVREGSVHQRFLERYLPGVRLAPYATEIEALEALEKGEVAAYFGDALRAAFWINDNPGCCRFAGDPYFRPDYFGAGLAVALPAGRDPVRQAIDYALLKLKREGTLDELYLRWFPVSFY